jgi:indole-3-glycerol phosphate synthase
MPSVLDEIMACTRRRVAETRKHANMRELEMRAEAHVPRGFQRRLAEKTKSGAAVIAELKKASPSKGLIRADFHPEILSVELEVAGAAGLSVLTDEQYFQGSLDYLRVASENTRLPCLRKDFIVDEFQILEARAHCADAVLLIVAALTDSKLGTLGEKCREFQLDVLCEVHDADELKRASDIGFDLIGVNNRNLKTLKVNLETSFRLAETMPRNVVRVAESGIGSGGDIARLRSAGYDAFLIGESLMVSTDPGDTLRKLLAEAEAAVPGVEI